MKHNELFDYTFKIGVVGYSDKKFDKEKAKELIHIAIQKMLDRNNITDPSDVEIVSGLTALGIPLLAYEYATDKGYSTTGIACKKANDYELFDVDKQIIVGDDWGDESPTFLEYINVLIRIGGGKQSREEVKLFKPFHSENDVIEYELEAENE